MIQHEGWTYTPKKEDTPNSFNQYEVHSVEGAINLWTEFSKVLTEYINEYNYNDTIKDPGDVRAYVKFSTEFLSDLKNTLKRPCTDLYVLHVCHLLDNYTVASQMRRRDSDVYIDSRVITNNMHRLFVASDDYLTMWKGRESLRFSMEIYREPYITDMPHAISQLMKRHRAHLSVDVPNVIAYTPDNAYGMADRQLRTRIGKYLTKYKKSGELKDITEEQIRDAVTIIVAAQETQKLQVARTIEEIIHVYRRGPNSCMGGYNAEWDSDLSPVAVYASPDLGVAYIYKPGSEDKISARTLVDVNRKRHSRIYGDGVRLRDALEAEGYTEGDLTGARVLKLEDGYDSRYLMPYIDYYGVNEYDDKYFKLVEEEDAEYDCNSTCGYLEDNRQFCDWEESYVSCDTTYVESAGMSVCDHCLEHSFVHARTRIFGINTWSYYPSDDLESHDVHWCEDEGEYCTEDWLEYNGYVYVEHVGEYHSADSCVIDHFTDEHILAEDAIEFYEREPTDEGFIVNTDEPLFTLDEDNLDDDHIEVRRYEVA